MLNVKRLSAHRAQSPVGDHVLTGSISEVLALNSESSCLTGGFSTSSIFILSEHLYVIIESG